MFSLVESLSTSEYPEASISLGWVIRRSHVQVVEWVLGSVRSAWTAPAWQQHVASPAAFLKHYMPVERSLQGAAEVLLRTCLHDLPELELSNALQ